MSGEIEPSGPITDAIELILNYLLEIITPDERRQLSDRKFIVLFNSVSSQLEEEREDGTSVPKLDARTTTKITLRGLYYRISELQENWEVFQGTSHDGDDILAFVENSEEILPSGVEKEDLETDEFREVLKGDFSEWLLEEGGRRVYLEESARLCLSFFTISQVLIEEYSKELIEGELIADDYRETGGTREFLEDLSQPEREQLLQRSETIPGHVVSSMVTVRRTRNDIVHELRGREYMEVVEDALSNVEQCIELLEKLEQHSRDESGFTW